jgi:hypothetical protein
MTTEPKPMPDEIYLEIKPATWGAMLFSETDPKNGKAIKYIRADRAEQCQQDTVAIPRDVLEQIDGTLARLLHLGVWSSHNLEKLLADIEPYVKGGK